jgi:hypothetical protein
VLGEDGFGLGVGAFVYDGRFFMAPYFDAQDKLKSNIFIIDKRIEL